MEKLLLTGENDGFYKLLKDELKEKYNVVECEFSEKNIRRTIRMQLPRVIVCAKADRTNAMLFEDTRKDFPNTGIVAVCDARDYSLDSLAGYGLVVLHRPINNTQIKEAIEKAIAETVVVQEAPKPRILAVDDNAIELRSIKSMLQNEYEIEFATSGHKALDMLKSRQYDLILLDYEMPEMSGYEVIQEIRTTPKIKFIPVVFLTGISERSKIVQLMSYLPDGYLLKPIDADMLHKTIKDLLNY